MTKKHNDINGWLILDKPKGISSAHAVAIVKRNLKPKKIGHAGTLDPLANGVLPLALGEATKTINFMMDSDKEYKFTVKWGSATTTYDCEGEVTDSSDKIPTKAEILAALPEFVGDIEQMPPVYSALKINGKRACDLAREGKEVVLKSRLIKVHKFELLACDDQSAEFLVACGKGTYVRSLAHDLAIKLGSFGHVTELTRTKVGKFCKDSAILLETLEKTVYIPESSGLILPVGEVLDDIPVLSFTIEDARLLRQGRQVATSEKILNDSIVVVKCEGVLVALANVFDGYVKPVRVFNL